MSKQAFPPRLHLRRADVNDLDWDGAEGDVHCINSPRSIFITHTDIYLSLSEHSSLLSEAVERARAAGMVQGVRAAGYQIMRSMSNQEEAEKARAVCEWLAGRFEAEAARAGGKDGEE